MKNQPTPKPTPKSQKHIRKDNGGPKNEVRFIPIRRQSTASTDPKPNNKSNGK
jgi:hypothetical protein